MDSAQSSVFASSLIGLNSSPTAVQQKSDFIVALTASNRKDVNNLIDAINPFFDKIDGSKLANIVFICGDASWDIKTNEVLIARNLEFAEKNPVFKPFLERKVAAIKVFNDVLKDFRAAHAAALINWALFFSTKRIQKEAGTIRDVFMKAYCHNRAFPNKKGVAYVIDSLDLRAAYGVRYSAAEHVIIHEPPGKYDQAEITAMENTLADLNIREFQSFTSRLDGKQKYLACLLVAGCPNPMNFVSCRDIRMEKKYDVAVDYATMFINFCLGGKQTCNTLNKENPIFKAGMLAVSAKKLQLQNRRVQCIGNSGTGPKVRDATLTVAKPSVLAPIKF